MKTLTLMMCLMSGPALSWELYCFTDPDTGATICEDGHYEYYCYDDPDTGNLICEEE